MPPKIRYVYRKHWPLNVWAKFDHSTRFSIGKNSKKGQNMTFFRPTCLFCAAGAHKGFRHFP